MAFNLANIGFSILTGMKTFHGRESELIQFLDIINAVKSMIPVDYTQIAINLLLAKLGTEPRELFNKIPNSFDEIVITIKGKYTVSVTKAHKRFWDLKKDTFQNFNTFAENLHKLANQLQAAYIQENMTLNSAKALTKQNVIFKQKETGISRESQLILDIKEFACISDMLDMIKSYEKEKSCELN